MEKPGPNHRDDHRRGEMLHNMPGPVYTSHSVTSQLWKCLDGVVRDH